jgi:hypothetical protein
MLPSAKRREYKRACSLICAHKYQAVLREAFWKFLLLVMDISHESDTQLVEFNVEYTYYGTSRKTPIFIGKTQLNSMRYDQLSSLIISEIPYLGRINVPIRYCIKDGKENEIDISPKYFTHQITRLLGSGLNAFSVRVNRHFRLLPRRQRTKATLRGTILNMKTLQLVQASMRESIGIVYSQGQMNLRLRFSQENLSLLH